MDRAAHFLEAVSRKTEAFCVSFPGASPGLAKVEAAIERPKNARSLGDPPSGNSSRHGDAALDCCRQRTVYAASAQPLFMTGKEGDALA